MVKEGNKKTVECAINGSSLDKTIACNDVLKPLVLVIVNNKIDY